MEPSKGISKGLATYWESVADGPCTLLFYWDTLSRKEAMKGKNAGQGKGLHSLKGENKGSDTL